MILVPHVITLLHLFSIGELKLSIIQEHDALVFSGKSFLSLLTQRDAAVEKKALFPLHFNQSAIQCVYSLFEVGDILMQKFVKTLKSYMSHVIRNELSKKYWISNYDRRALMRTGVGSWWGSRSINPTKWLFILVSQQPKPCSPIFCLWFSISSRSVFCAPVISLTEWQFTHQMANWLFFLLIFSCPVLSVAWHIWWNIQNTSHFLLSTLHTRG